MHPSMQRLLALAESGRKAAPITGDSVVASALNISPQTLYNWKQRGVSEGGAIAAAKMFGGDANHILEGTPLNDDVPPPRKMDHGMSYPQVTTPPITPWGDIVSLEKTPAIPADLMVEVPDEALANRDIRKGQFIWFKAANTAEPADVVLIEANGRRYIRRYTESGRAEATDTAYVSFEENFKIVAVMFMLQRSKA